MWPCLWRHPGNWVILRNQVWIDVPRAEEVVAAAEKWAEPSWGQKLKSENRPQKRSGECQASQKF
jgi:hypothetical protein